MLADMVMYFCFNSADYNEGCSTPEIEQFQSFYAILPSHDDSSVCRYSVDTVFVNVSYCCT